MVDANKRPYSSDLYAGKTDVAHINHYMCRSHENWMKRVDLGAVAFTKDNYPRNKDHRWRFDRALAQKKFVEIAVEMNEIADDYMLKYAEPIRAFLRDVRSA